MKDLSLNISFQQCHSKQHVPSSPKGYPDGYRERWGLISGTWRFFAALRSALNDGIRCIVLSNKQIASGNNASERHCEDVGRSSLLITFRGSIRDCFVAKFHFVHFAPRNDGNYEDLLKWN